MRTKKTIRVINSWNIPSFGILAEVENTYNGLPKGTVLKSQETERSWIVESRIIETLAIDKLTRFPNETETPIHLNFRTFLDLEKAKEGIVALNENRIFQYKLKPKEHGEKPKSGEKLLIYSKY